MEDILACKVHCALAYGIFLSVLYVYKRVCLHG